MLSLVLAVTMTTAGYSFLPWTDDAGRPLSYGARPTSLPTGCEPFAVERPRERDGAVVDAADFGVSEAIDDNTAALQRAIDHCRAVGAKRLTMKKGTYRFFGAHSVVFAGLRDFTFDAQGATLVFRRATVWRPDELIWQATFHPEDANFHIHDCERCRFANYVMDWDWETDPLATFARATAVVADEKNPVESYVDFVFPDYERHPVYPKPLSLQCVTGMAESRDAFAPTRIGGGSLYLNLCDGGYGRAMTWLSPNRIRVWFGKRPTAPGTHWKVNDEVKTGIASAKRIAEETGLTLPPTQTLARVRMTETGRLYRISHYYPGKSGVYMEANRHLTIENETILSCRGMAHVIEGAQHHTHFLHVTVAPPPGGKRPISSTADSMHVANSCGWLKLEDFRVSLNQDDFSNIHDITSCGRRTGTRTVKITHLRGNLYFRGQVGDRIEFLNPDFSPTGFSANIVKIDGETFEMDRDVPTSLPEPAVFVNRARGTDHVWWKDCVIDRYWGRATMMGNDFTFENCTFRSGNSSPLKIQAAFHPGRWAEGAGATNHVYRGCTFENNQIHNRPPFGDLAADIFVGTNIRTMDYEADLSKKPWNGAVRDILFERCRFIRPRGALAHFYSGSNLIFRDNEIVVGPAKDFRYHPYRGSIRIDFAQDVSISGNRLVCEDPSVRPGVSVRTNVR